MPEGYAVIQPRAQIAECVRQHAIAMPGAMRAWSRSPSRSPSNGSQSDGYQKELEAAKRGKRPKRHLGEAAPGAPLRDRVRTGFS